MSVKQPVSFCLVFVMVAFGAAFLTGCESDGPGSDCFCVPEGESCFSDYDCEGALLCEGGICTSITGGGGSCTEAGQSCSASSECCSSICVSDYGKCADGCSSDSQCHSGCCAPLESGGGACSPDSYCN